MSTIRCKFNLYRVKNIARFWRQTNAAVSYALAVSQAVCFIKSLATAVVVMFLLPSSASDYVVEVNIGSFNTFNDSGSTTKTSRNVEDVQQKAFFVRRLSI